MAVTMLRPREVWKRCGNSRSSYYAAVKAGLMVKPVKIGERAVATPDYEVDQVNAARIAGKSPEEVTALVKQLEAARGHSGQKAQL